jgi:hypothetical protein
MLAELTGPLLRHASFERVVAVSDTTTRSIYSPRLAAHPRSPPRSPMQGEALRATS